ncbi:MAG: PepSY-associated TM helix domain-containing protein, partial [Pseudomonadota bacterium]
MRKGTISTPAPPAKAEKTTRNKLYKLHTWVGFHLAFLMSLILFTGTFATISNEIDWLIQSDMRVSPQGERISWGKLEAIALNYRPGHTISSISHMKSDYFAYRARMIDEYGKGYFLHINQWTGEVTGTSPTLTVQRFFRDIHRYLFMPNFIGLPLVTSFAFILAISLYTGLKTTRKWGAAATRIRFHKQARVVVGDVHRMAGIWSIWFFVLMIMTSLWYLAEFGSYIVQSPFEPERPEVTDERVQAYGPAVRYADADTLVKAAKTAYPELEPRIIFYPFNAKGAVMVLGRNNDVLIRDRANRVFLDPVDASIIKVQRAEDISWAAYLNEMADPLHFGYFGGLGTKLIWFIFGLAMTGLSISGVWLTWKRLKTVTISRAQFATMPVLFLMMLAGVFWYERQ